jgi:hypothetical protein
MSYRDEHMAEAGMASERFSRYQFELTGAQMEDGAKWVPYVEIRIRTDQEADGPVIFPRQRIAGDEAFDSEDDAIEEARRFAMAHVSSGEF